MVRWRDEACGHGSRGVYLRARDCVKTLRDTFADGVKDLCVCVWGVRYDFKGLRERVEESKNDVTVFMLIVKRLCLLQLRYGYSLGTYRNICTLECKL